MAKITVNNVRFYDEDKNELIDRNEINEKMQIFEGTICGSRVKGSRNQVNFFNQKVKIGKENYRFCTHDPSLIALEVTKPIFFSSGEKQQRSAEIIWANNQLKCGRQIKFEAQTQFGPISDTITKIQENVLIGEQLTYKITE